MKVKIAEIPEEGITLTEQLNPASLELETVQVQFASPLDVTATFERKRDTVLVRGVVAGKLTLVCGRCLESFGQQYESSFDLDYSVQGKEKEMLDVTHDLQQEILLSYPMQFLCREDCQGLCPQCGKKLNEGKCGCAPH